MKYDLLIRNGTVIDPAREIHAPLDVAFVDGNVAAVADSLVEADAAQVIDAAGRYVTPGLIDVHVHVFPGVSHFGIEPDPTCLARGATTVVDAGSAGADTFPGFRKYLIEVSETRILAQLNISSQGMLSRHVGEFALPEYADVDACCRMIEQHRDLILGVKVRLTKNSIVAQSAGMTPLHRAREAADAAGLPIMVHPQAAWCDSIDDILKVMKKGDILTHTFHGSACGIMDGDSGKVRASVLDAIERGVIFDVGHGAGSFSWDVVEAAMAEGVVAGGGVALLRASDELEAKVIKNIGKLSDEESVGVRIVKDALAIPARQIAENAGEDGSVVVSKIKEAKANFGFNARTNTYEDLMKAGVVDPVKVTRHAIQAAGSIAGLVLTTETLVSDIPEEKSSMPDMPDMGGMGGMM